MLCKCFPENECDTAKMQFATPVICMSTTLHWGNWDNKKI